MSVNNGCFATRPDGSGTCARPLGHLGMHRTAGGRREEEGVWRWESGSTFSCQTYVDARLRCESKYRNDRCMLIRGHSGRHTMGASVWDDTPQSEPPTGLCGNKLEGHVCAQYPKHKGAHRTYAGHIRWSDGDRSLRYLDSHIGVGIKRTVDSVYPGRPRRGHPQRCAGRFKGKRCVFTNDHRGLCSWGEHEWITFNKTKNKTENGDDSTNDDFTVNGHPRCQAHPPGLTDDPKFRCIRPSYHYGSHEVPHYRWTTESGFLRSKADSPDERCPAKEYGGYRCELVKGHGGKHLVGDFIWDRDRAPANTTSANTTNITNITNITFESSDDDTIITRRFPISWSPDDTTDTAMQHLGLLGFALSAHVEDYYDEDGPNPHRRIIVVRGRRSEFERWRETIKKRRAALRRLAARRG